VAGRARRIFLSAGEPSGDLHGAPLVAALRARLPGVELEALGGARMRAAGATVRFPLERYTVMGLVEVVRSLPRHWRLLRRLEQEFRTRRFDLVVLIDYPGFNLRLAEAARRHGVKVLYYIAPKYWASGAGRTKRLARAVDRLAVILPFEPAFFARYGLVAEPVGHPLLDQPAGPSRDAARRTLGLGPDERVLALLPGSRPQEVKRLWPAFREAASLLRARGDCDRVVVAAVASGTYPDAAGALLRCDDTATILAAADAALVKSGTATLEAGLAGVPMVVAYRLHWLSAWVARRMLTVRWISLVNLIAGRAVVAELLQQDVRADRLAEALAPLLRANSAAARQQKGALGELRARLGEPGVAPRVAAIAGELIA